MLPTVAEVLALDPVRRGAPRLLAAADRLATPVRWVHAIELAAAAHLLRGGELVLSTGIALPSDDAGLARYVAELAAVGISALAVELGPRYARSLPPALVAVAAAHRADADAVLAGLARRLRPRLLPGEVIGAGSVTESVTGGQQTFLEADQVAAVAARAPAGRPFYRLPDLRLRGLLHLLRDDPRLQAFAERELGPLLLHDAGGGPLLAALTAYLEAGGNKAEAAKRARLARPTLYERLRQIAAVLGTSLEPPESRLSLHVALLALGAIGSPAPAGG
jgi:hypothetical protein